MKLCKSEKIVKYYFTYLYKKSLFMFIEYMDSGDLSTFIEKNFQAIPEKVIAFILKNILEALNSLHTAKQLHRDLKSDNILLSSAG